MTATLPKEVRRVAENGIDLCCMHIRNDISTGPLWSLSHRTVVGRPRDEEQPHPKIPHCKSSYLLGKRCKYRPPPPPSARTAKMNKAVMTITSSCLATMPPIGLGTISLTGADVVRKVIKNATAIEYRRIDCAPVNFNEEQIGDVSLVHTVIHNRVRAVNRIRLSFVCGVKTVKWLSWHSD